MLASCAACGETMWMTALQRITVFGPVNNICSDECLKIYNNSDVVLKQAVSTKDVSVKSEN